MKDTCGTFIDKGCVEIDDWRTSPHLYWSFKKLHANPTFVSIIFSDKKGKASKTSTFSHP